MWKNIEKISTIGGAIGTIGIFLTIGWYVFDLEWRVRSLEAQLQAITTTPPASSQTAPDAPNPITHACAEISRRLNEAIEPVGFGNRVDAYTEQLKLLNCGER
ncbi:hypothetical protein [Ensifer aridi]|uniref:hypothetical protein n=1 Tax=Ensifer aridi TaxID=1708715 RepID=UPI00111C4CBA|nr:hypothetical protein [Ensifer aridi]